MTSQKRYAIVGTGSRAGMYVQAMTATYRESAELVAFCDLSQTRMDWYNQQLQTNVDCRRCPTYLAAQFDQMIAETKPDVVIVTTMDSTHHHLHHPRDGTRLRCDHRKADDHDRRKTARDFDAIDRTGKSLRVTFNYRYAPAYTRCAN